MSEPQPQKVVVITGAASGIGFAMAKAFSACGYSVALTDISEKRYPEGCDNHRRENCRRCMLVYRRCEGSGGKQECLGEGPRRAWKSNNAGIVVRQKARLEDLPAGHFEEMMAIHVNGTLNWSRLVLPSMRETGFGRIINVSSVNAIDRHPSF